VSLVPGFGIVKGMALTLRRFFEPKVTHLYPEDPAVSPHKFRGRLQLLYDEYGTLKCETCFQCAQACPIECIDMGGVDTKGRFAIHWGASETYGERREESALRRSGRTVPDPVHERFPEVDLGPLDAILEEHDYDPRHLLAIFEGIQAVYGHLPVAALQRVSQATGAGYALLYGTASFYGHLHLAAPADASAVGGGEEQGSEAPTASDAAFLGALDAALTGRGTAGDAGDAGDAGGGAARDKKAGRP
jgi:ferredoxin